MKPKKPTKKKRRLRNVVLGFVSLLAKTEIAKTNDVDILRKSLQQQVAPIPIKRGYNPFSPTGFAMKECGRTGQAQYDDQILDEAKSIPKSANLDIRKRKSHSK